MSYQFLHIEAYAREAGKGKAGGNSIHKIAAEADRLEGNCPHVATPQKPIIRYGVSAKKAAELSQKWADEAKDKSNRSLRKDGLCLVAGVISYPAEGENWENFRDASEKWLKKKYGDRLKSIIEHTDEAHPHIHFYVVPRAGERLESIHEGKAAAQEKSEQKLKKGAQNAAYIEAMRALQDTFSREVGVFHGMLRIGPKKRRLSRPAWHKEKQQAAFLASAKKVHSHVAKKARAEGLEKGRAQAQAELELAKKEANKFANIVGEAASEFAKSISSTWHKPTKEAKKEVEGIERKRAQDVALVSKGLKTQKELVERQRVEAQRTKAQHEFELERLKRTVRNTEADLIEANKKIAQLNAQLIYEKRNNPKNRL